MGIFDFLKSKNTPTIKFEQKSVQAETYNPWGNKTVPRNDDYAIAAFINVSQKGSTVGKKNDDYARWFSYEYKVNNPVQYHKNVIAEGYLVEADASVALCHLKVAELKEILIKNGLSDKGKKDVLIERILDNVDVKSLCLETYYIPSEKGVQHLKKYDYVFRLNRYGISHDEFDAKRSVSPEYLKPNDIIWQILNDREMEYSIKKQYGHERLVCLYRARLLEDENKNIDALSMYIHVLYYDTSGCEDNYITPVNQIVINAEITSKICELRDFYDSRILERCYQRQLPHHNIYKKDFARLLEDIFNDEPIDLMKYTKKVRN